MSAPSANAVSDSASREHSESALTEGNDRDSKRKKRDVAQRAPYPRKRAVTACELCRSRKAKCDNQRPTCGRCLELNMPCSFQGPITDYTSLDPGSLTILGRLNYAINILEQHSQALNHLQSQQWSLVPSPGITAVCPPADDVPFPISPASPFGQGETLKFTVTPYCAAEEVLQWPIFGNRYDRRNIELLILNPSGPPAGGKSHTSSSEDYSRLRANRTSPSSRGIREEDVFGLSQVFLENVLTKNPVLDAREVKHMVKAVSENSFGWDSQSCLLLIICALGSICKPYTSEKVQADENGAFKDVSSLKGPPDYPAAEAYYNASRKRIGLLDNSTLAIQCYFWSGVYEMYSMRPFLAWRSFHQACVVFQTYRKQKSKQILDNEHDPQGLDHRLYWSCLKSECEIRAEIDLPESGLANVNYPDIFPSPPSRICTPDLEASEEMSEAIANQGSPADPAVIKNPKSTVQCSWYYYLAEIAAQRIADRLMHSFYMAHHTEWLAMPIDRMIRVASELDRQLTQWSAHLPSSLIAVEGTTPEDELPHMLQLRLIGLRERVYRPFIYLVIHGTDSVASLSTVRAFALKSLETCIMYTRVASLSHRHHGSWYTARHMFVFGLVLLAAARSERIAMPEDWQLSVNLAQAYLQYWEDESPDLEASRTVLVQVFNDLSAVSEADSRESLV